MAVIKELGSYRQRQVEASSPAQLVLLLLASAHQRALLASRACETSKDKERGEAVRKCLDIVIELRSSLDHTQGPEVAANLDRLYDFVITSVVSGHGARDTAKLAQAAQVLDVLREAWSQIVHVEPGPRKEVPKPEPKPEPVALHAPIAQPAPAPEPARAPLPAARAPAASAALRRYAALR